MSVRARDHSGFTLIETLVVVLIVAVLAAIGIVLFVNQRAKAQDADAKTMATLAAQTLVMWEQDTGTYAASPADLVRLEPSLSAARNLRVVGDADSYEVEVESASRGAGGGPFWIRRGPDDTERGCDAPGQGACRGDGTW